MATVTELIDTLCEWCHVSRSDLLLRTRMLREARLLPTSKRGGGRSAAHLDSHHAARVLIGLLCQVTETSAAAEVVEAVKKFGSLTSSPIVIFTGENEWGPLVLPDTFQNALTSIITGLRYPNDPHAHTYDAVKAVGMTKRGKLVEAWVEIEDKHNPRSRCRYTPPLGKGIALKAFKLEAEIPKIVLDQVAAVLGLHEQQSRQVDKQTARRRQADEPLIKAKRSGTANATTLNARPHPIKRKKKNQSLLSASPHHTISLPPEPGGGGEENAKINPQTQAE